MKSIFRKIKDFWGKLNKKKITTWLVISAIVLAIVLFVVISGARKRAASTSAYQTETVKQGSLIASIGATGTVHSNQTAVLTWQASGSVAVVNAKVGDQVRTGDVLASLSQTSLSQNVVLAQADLVTAQRNLDSVLHSNTQSAQAQVDLNTAQHNYDSAKSSLDLKLAQNRGGTSADIQEAQSRLALAQDALDKAQTAYDRVKDNSDSDPLKAQAYLNLYNAQQSRNTAQDNLNFYLLKPSNSSIDQSRANLALAEAKLADAQREWDRLKNGPDPNDVIAAQARVDAAQATVNMSRLIAPFVGTITEADPIIGDQVSPGNSGFRVDDLTHLLVDVQVSEVDINTVSIGQQVAITFDAAFGKEYHGKVIAVAQVGSSIQGVVSFTVSVELSDADAQVKPGMTAAVTIVVKQLDNVLLVPNRAVRLVNDQRVVYVMSNGKVIQTVVTLGATSDTNSEVLTGLKKGDVIILNPSDILQAGNSGRPSFAGG